MSLLVKVFVDKGHDWHDCLDGSCALVVPEHLILLQARVDRLKQRIEDDFVEEFRMWPQTAQMRIQKHTG